MQHAFTQPPGHWPISPQGGVWGMTTPVLMLFFPANIYAAIQHVPMGGHAWGPVYLLVRAPLQAAILLWVYRFTIRRQVGRD